MSDWRPRVEGMVRGDIPTPPPVQDDWVTPAEPAPVAAADDWITPQEPPTISGGFGLPNAPSIPDAGVVAAPLGRIAAETARGAWQGFREGGVIPAGDYQRSIETFGPVAGYPLNVLASGIDLAARAGSGVFRGGQAAVQQAFSEIGQPALGRDVAAMPEAFAGSPGGMRRPGPPRPAAPEPPAVPPLMLEGPPRGPTPPAAPTSPPPSSGPRPPAPPQAPPSGPTTRPGATPPTTWDGVLQAEGVPPPAPPRPPAPPATSPQATTATVTAPLPLPPLDAIRTYVLETGDITPLGIMTQFGIPPQAVRQALAQLDKEGVLAQVRAGGALVAAPPVPPDPPPPAPWSLLDSVISESERRQKYPGVPDEIMVAKLNEAIANTPPQGFVPPVFHRLMAELVGVAPMGASDGSAPSAPAPAPPGVPPVSPVTSEEDAEDPPISQWQRDNIQVIKDLLDKAPLIRAQIKYLHEEGMVAKEIAEVIGWDVDTVRTARDIIGLKPHGPAGGMAFPSFDAPDPTPQAPDPLAGNKASLAEFLDDPRTNDEIRADLATQQTQEIKDAKSSLPPGFTIEQTEGEWRLNDPAGELVASVLGARPPSSETLQGWVEDAKLLSAQIDWSAYLAPGAGAGANPVVVQQPGNVASAAGLTGAVPPGAETAATVATPQPNAAVPLASPPFLPPAAAGNGADAGRFTTAKGSSYVVHADGTTTRDKAYRPEHGAAEQGPQPRSERTFYVTADDAKKLAEFQTQGTRKKISVRGNQAGVTYLDGPSAGKTERRTVVPINAEPAVGLTPVEMWKDGTVVHFGNEITESQMGATNDAIIAEANALETALAAGALPGAAEMWDQPQLIEPGELETAEDGASRPSDDPRPDGEDADPGQAAADAGKPPTVADDGSKDIGAQDGGTAGTVGVVEPGGTGQGAGGQGAGSGAGGNKPRPRPGRDTGGGTATAVADVPAPKPSVSAPVEGSAANGESVDERNRARRERETANFIKVYGLGRPEGYAEIVRRKAEAGLPPAEIADGKSTPFTEQEVRDLIEHYGWKELTAKQREKVRKERAAAGARRKWTQIGWNRDDNPLFEDESGVRSYTESGIRLTEVVGINPGGGIIIKTDETRSRDYLVARPMPSASEEGSDDAGTTVLGESSEALGGVAAEDGAGDAPEGDAEPGSAEGEPGSGATGGGPDGSGDAKVRGGGDGSAGPDLSDAGEVAPKPPRAKKAAKPKPEKAAAPDMEADPVVVEDAPDPVPLEPSPGNIPAINFTIDDSLDLGVGSEGQKYQDNLEAIRTLKRIEADGRRATPEEQRILARYVGWGGLKNAFRVAGSAEGAGVAKGWEKRVAEVEALLTPQELKAARSSTDAAHYTSQTVVEAMWRAVDRLGFMGGSVLEPSAGVGNFIGLMPEQMRGQSRVVAVEYDSITARIAKNLYPGETVLHSGIQNVPLPTDQFALAIGNPPFGNRSLYFRYNAAVNGSTIHNQIFQASLDAVAPGGLMAMVVSHFLMDSLDARNRMALAAKGEFVAGIRLPDTAFKENARTEVVTDILFFRKRSEQDATTAEKAIKAIQSGKDPEKDKRPPFFAEVKQEIERWTQAAATPDPAGTDAVINVNGYFLRNPGMVVGKINATGTMYGTGASLNVTMDDPSQFEKVLNGVVSTLPSGFKSQSLADRSLEQYELMADAMRLAVDRVEVGAITRTTTGALKMVVAVDAGSLGKALLREVPLTADTPFQEDYSYRPDGKWERTDDVKGADGAKVKAVDAAGKPTRYNAKATTVYDNAKDIPKRHQWGKERIELVTDMLPLRDLLKKQLVLESQDAPTAQLDENRAKLNKAYDAFVKKHGKLHEAATVKIAMKMPDGALALSIEANVGTKDKPSYGKAPIMTRRVTSPPKAVERVANVEDAIAVVLGDGGQISLDRIAELLGTDAAGAEKALSEGDDPRAFYDPEAERWEAKDSYLSGLVRKKLNAAREAGLEANVKALEAVLPVDWTSAQVTPNIGSSWIPEDVYAEYIKTLGYGDTIVRYSALTNSFTVRAEGSPKAQWRAADDAWPADAVVERLLNSRSMKVTEPVEGGGTVLNAEATEASKAMAAEIFNDFQDWAYRDNDRRERLTAIFNEKFNTRVLRQRDGSHLTLPGKVPDQVIQMRRHQMNAIWRGITDPVVLYDHVVGAGKTFVAISRIMERRRMGLSRKAMVVVPNHLVEQWAADVALLYPGANVLAAGKADFDKKNRRRLFAKIGSGDYDMVIVGHSSFGFIDLDQATEERFLEEELQAAIEGVQAAREQAIEDGYASGFRKPLGVAEAERLVAKIEARLAKLREGKRDRLLTFEEMGIDDLTIDEAHEFKNLAYTSRLTGVSGMGNRTGSQKAMDLHLKLRSLRERQGSSVAFLTGTPISNSVAEMYLILKNLAPKELKELGLDNFDAWRSLFVSTASAWEPTEAGGMKEVQRLGREWTNMKALMDLYYSVTDAVTLQDLQDAFAEDNPGKKFPVPDIVSRRQGKGERDEKTVKPTPQQRAILADIVSGFEGLKDISDPKERSAEMLRLMDRGRKNSLDARAVDPRIKVAPGVGKIGAVVDNVFRIYEKWDADKGTQIVFLDRSVPKAKGDDEKVKKYDEWRAKLAQAEADQDEAEQSKIADKLAEFDGNEIEALRNALAGGWNGYQEIKDQLVAKGIPPDEIRFIQEANTDEQKKAMFDMVKSGKVRVLLGSTPRLGAGTNVQDRLVGLHHVDVTWKPSDIEQREGRIIRQGNSLLAKYGDDFAVEIIAYATEMTMDAKMWSLNSSKLKALNAIRKYDGSFMMEFEDEESESMAEMAARATGNPLMVERVVLTAEIQKLQIQQRGFNNVANSLRGELQTAERLLETGPTKIADSLAFADEVAEGAAAARESTAERKVTVEGKTYTTREAAGAAADAAIAKIKNGEKNARYSIEVDGEKVTSEERVQANIRRKLGTEDFLATVDGVEYIDSWAASKAIAEKYTSRGVGKTTLDGIIINGVPIELDVEFNSYAKEKIEIFSSALSASGRAMQRNFSRTSFAVNAKTGSALGISPGAIWGNLSSLIKDMDPPSKYKWRADSIKEDMAKAEASIPALKEQSEKPWPKADELAAKRERIAFVTEALKDASFSTALDDNALDVVAPVARPFSASWSTTLDDAGDWSAEGPGSSETWRSVSLRVGGDMPGYSASAGAQQAAIDAVQKIIGPQGAVEPLGARKTAAGTTLAAGLDVGGIAVGGLMRVAMGASGEAFQWSLHHEAIHVLRNLGLFTPGEWATLQAAAKRQGWIDRFDLRARYPGYSEEKLIEEAISEAFGAASMQGDNAPGGGVVLRAWSKTKRFLEAFRNGLAGRGLRSGEGVFEDTRAGRVGAREAPMMDRRGPETLDEARRMADENLDRLTVPDGEGGEVDLMAGMSPELKRILAAGAKDGVKTMVGVVQKLWGNAALPDGVTVDEGEQVRDINGITSFVKVPLLAFAGTEMEPVIRAGIKAEQDQSAWITRLVHRYDAVRKELKDAGGDFDKVTEALWAGDADQVDMKDPTAVSDLFYEWSLTDAEARAFREVHTILDTLARMVDNHRREMMPRVRQEKEDRIASLEYLLNHAKVSGAEARGLYRLRGTITRRIAKGKSLDMRADAAQVQAINTRLRELRAADPANADRIGELQDAIDAAEAKLNEHSVRDRLKGYVPHKFYGSWRLWELGETDPETGERARIEVTSDQGFYNTREDAIQAAVQYRAENPDAEMLIEPKQIKWPVGINGTTMSDGAFGQLARNLAINVGIRGNDLNKVLNDVARRRTRRRLYTPGMHRSGAAGYSRDMDRIMRTHIGQTVRYVTMDKLKYRAITAAEAAGLSPYRTVTQDRPNLQRAFEAWLRDVNGGKQGFEEAIDSVLRRLPMPASVLLTGASAFALGSIVAAPLVGVALAGFAGYQMYKALTGKALPWRPPEYYTDFPTRQFTSHMTTAMAHWKLGAIFNVKSAVVNLSQTAINTWPEIGSKYTAIGMDRARSATWAAMRGKPTADTRLLERAGVQTLYRITDAGPVMAEQESALAKASMWMFTSAENANRAVAFFGGYQRALDGGAPPGEAMAEGKRVMEKTQFHMGNANKPELLRQQWARMPFQFKNFLAQTIARMFGLTRTQVAKTLVALTVFAGVMGSPAFTALHATTKLVAGFSLIDWTERFVLDRAASGGWGANLATVFASGLPAVYTNLSQSIGMGPAFLPTSMRDLQGPWIGFLMDQAKAAQLSAPLVDRLAIASPAFNALKALEAAANGRSITSSGFWDPEVWGDGKAVWTDWRQKGAELYQPSTGQLIAKALNFTPAMETAIRTARRQAALLEKEAVDERAGYLADIIQARRNGDYGSIRAIKQKARAAGVMMTDEQIANAIERAQKPALVRATDETPQAFRRRVFLWGQGVMGTSPPP
ncbi:SNF2-related, N-terminal domain containing protein [uncultured Caudovirales phage]|uniref:SNF2-related, N-terminal domain containing protein n=1 Tax=uncultured Caudovirales phage TaxID=2100421 RepID=A0A6J5MEX1_9CAUD|nr:SNF2-related, N-terminal domain containing protein [uncultured Caudovirales phage]CAB4190021.1 SNF2-related, N-terminal domain containing protein [uncultured Caudovirales phage]